jgi:hypothetical protein
MIDGKKMEFAGDSNTLNAWVWEDLGTFNLSRGQLPMTLSRTYGNDEEYSVFVDALLITLGMVNPPDQVKAWESVANTGEVASTSNEYTLPVQQGARPGNTPHFFYHNSLTRPVDV